MGEGQELECGGQRLEGVPARGEGAVKSILTATRIRRGFRAQNPPLYIKTNSIKRLEIANQDKRVGLNKEGDFQFPGFVPV